MVALVIKELGRNRLAKHGQTPVLKWAVEPSVGDFWHYARSVYKGSSVGKMIGIGFILLTVVKHGLVLVSEYELETKMTRECNSQMLWCPREK